MADVLKETLQDIATNVINKVELSSEDMLIAYISLVAMACATIFIGSLRSVACLQKKKDSGQKAVTMSKKEAAMVPLIASCGLVGLYVVIKLVSKEYINFLVTPYFFVLGVLSLTRLVRPFVSKFVPDSYNAQRHLVYKEIIDYRFETADVIAFGLCSLIGGVYFRNKHWIINNIFVISFVVNSIEFIHLNNIMIGCTFLGGHFVYDIFWVFATDVMVTVAKSFEAPIKLIVPQDLAENWIQGSNFCMLGIGDIVIPGVFIAFLLRFDESLRRGQKVYFYSSFIAYFIGLVVTLFIMTIFKHAQPALLYLVPACIGIPATVALIKGDGNALLKYHDYPEVSEQEKNKAE